jgi:hypothetical protein
MNAITVLPNMTVPPVARGQDYAFVAKALHVDSGNPAGCDKIAHESKPLGVDKKNIRIAAPCSVESLTGTLRDHVRNAPVCGNF